ncbi:amino acid/polyamine transporter I [Phascolomyces articulosus]|uniref:Amino acid/polyamine transporter I n=1 Tax=Phascolomyces articulosus TaxID=60185 RepID=A0AAD5PIL9_9FUNG|nr:amino acid/polyamine transporter I [Phascolomyces articulosus]
MVNINKNEANGDALFSNKGVELVIFIIYTVMITAYCTLGMKFNAYMNRVLVVWTALGTLIVSITLPVMSPINPSASWVFTGFNNETGYSNSGIAFFLGLLPASVTMIGYENGAHISEGTKNAAITGPRGILISVVSAVFQGILLCCITLFSVQDVDELINASYPVGTLFLRSTNTSVAIFFLVVIAVALIGCSCSMLLSAAQMIFAMSRDGLLPGHRYWYSLSKNYQVPLRALLLLCLVSILAVLPSLGSDVYLSIVLSTTVIFMNTSYCIPCVCRLIWKRHDMPKGPFNLGRYSILIHSIAVAWILFIDVIMCMPRQVNPLVLLSMNWSSVMLGFVIFIAFGLWIIGPTVKGLEKTGTCKEEKS